MFNSQTALTLATLFAVTYTGATQVKAQGLRPGDFNYVRRYQNGQSLKYHFRIDSYEDGHWTDGQNGTAVHHVERSQAGDFFEAVRWTHYSQRDERGETAHDDWAQAVPVYDLSLSQGGTNDAPTATVPQLYGFLTDYQTFYVALAPAMGITALHQIGDTFSYPDLVRGRWTLGDIFVHGEGAYAVTLALLDLNSTQAYVRVAFEPPAQASIIMDRDFMNDPVDGRLPNNWVSVRGRHTTGYDEVSWGHEEMIIVGQVDRQSGRINWASMMNVITMRTRKQCDLSMTHCDSDKLTEQRRTLHMGLL
jgi:hypothetical protein